MTRYYLDEHSIDLNALKDRLQSTDLIPSQGPLLDKITARFSSIRQTGVQSVADLRSALRTAQSLALLSENSGVDVEYLTLLKRALNGFFPKPRSLEEIDWLDKKTVVSLKKVGVKNTQQLFEAASGDVAGLARRSGTRQKELSAFKEIANLCRIQWVSPTFARVLAAAGFKNAAAVAAADPEALFEAITAANENAKFYKGKVGLRDVKRLVTAAAYVP